MKRKNAQMTWENFKGITNPRYIDIIEKNGTLLQSAPWSIRKILMVEATAIQNIFGSDNFSRYSFQQPDDGEQVGLFSNYITRKNTDVDFKIPRSPKRNSDEMAYYRFSKVMHPDFINKLETGKWVHSNSNNPAEMLYISEDTKVKIFLTPDPKNAENTIIFVNLGKEHVWGEKLQESVLLLRVDNTTPAEIAADKEAVSTLLIVRSEAKAVYKERNDHNDERIYSMQDLVIQGLPTSNRTIGFGYAFLLFDDVNMPVSDEIYDWEVKDYNSSLAEVVRKEIVDTVVKSDISILEREEIAEQLIAGLTNDNYNEKLEQYYALIQEKYGIFVEQRLKSAFMIILNNLATISNSIYQEQIEPFEAISQQREGIVKNVEKFKLMGSDFDQMRIPLENAAYICDRLTRLMKGIEETRIPENSIVIGNVTSESQFFEIIDRKATGIVSTRAHDTSHVVIIGKQERFPIIPAHSIENLYDLIDSGDEILINSFTGEIIINPSEETKQQALQLQKHWNKVITEFKSPEVMINNRLVQVQINSGSDVDEQIELDPEQYFSRSIGLFRMEFKLLEDNQEIPDADKWYETFSNIIGRRDSFEHITARTLDFGRDKNPYEGFPPVKDVSGNDIPLVDYISNNPIVKDSVIDYIKGLIRTAHENPEASVDLLFPMVRDHNDFYYYKRLYREALAEMGMQVNNIKLGVMIETTQSVQDENLQNLIDAADFVSIGTNDLTMSILNKDERVDTKVGLSPAVLNTITNILIQAEIANVPVKICGEMASDPVIATLLYSLGNYTPSVNNVDVPFVTYYLNYAADNDLFTKISRVYTEKLSKLAASNQQDGSYDQSMFIRELYNEVADLLNYPIN